MALRAMPVAAGVVGDLCIGTLLTARNMAAEGCGTAVLDRRHHLELAEAQMADIGPAPGGPIGAEDIRDLHSRPRRGHRALRRQLNVLKRAPAKQRNSLGGHGMLLFTAD